MLNGFLCEFKLKYLEKVKVCYFVDKSVDFSKIVNEIFCSEIGL